LRVLKRAAVVVIFFQMVADDLQLFIGAAGGIAF
jgi:hypothetical protein